MFPVATANLQKHHARYRRVIVLSEGGKIKPMTCLKLSEEPGTRTTVKVEVTPYSLYNIINSTTKTIKNIEKAKEEAVGIEGVYLYKTTSLQGAWLKALSGFTIPRTDKNGCHYYKCNMYIKGLYTTAIDLIEFDTARKNWWTVDTNDPAYRTVLNIAPYEIGLVTSVLQTSKPVELTTEVIWIPDIVQDIREDAPYENAESLPQHTKIGQCQKLVIPEDTTLAYQYVQLDVDAVGRIDCVFSDTAGTLRQKDMSDALQLIPHDAESEKFEKGCAVPVLKLSDENQYELVENNLERILTRPEVMGLHVCVYSIAGAFRGGKTFILNFFKKFLEGKHVRDWLIGQKSKPSDSFFEWRDGDDAHTKGLILWSKPFVVETDKNRKVAVLLMDTQGTFDDESTDKDCATIFALSTLLASIQVFNIRRQIQEDQLKSLQFFMEYGKFAAKDQDSTPFQILHFLIRDYPTKKDAFGYEGGAEYLKKKFKPSMLSAIGVSTNREGDLLRAAIKEMFEDIVCFLLPRPSDEVQDGEPFDYNNPTKNPRDKRFITHVQDLVYGLLAPAKLVVKTQSGEKLTSETFLILFKELAMLFTKGDMPKLHTVMETTANANNMMAAKRSTDAFNFAMQKFVSEVTKASYKADNSFESFVAREKEKAITEFKNAPKLGGDTYAKQHLEELKSELTIIGQRYQDMIADIPTESEIKQNCKAAIITCMELHEVQVKQFRDSKKDVDTLERDEISVFFETLEKGAVEKFNQHRKLGSIEMHRSTLDELQRQMKQSREACMRDLAKIPTMDQAVRSQEDACKAAEQYFKDALSKAMETEIKKTKVEMESYNKQIEKVKTTAREKFNNCKKAGGRRLEAQFMDKLEKCMIDAYNETVDIVRSKARQSAVSFQAYTLATSRYTESMDAFLEDQEKLITVEKDEVDKRHHKTLQQCKDDMMRFDPDIPILLEYVDKLNSKCDEKHDELWAKLCHKPSKLQLKTQNTEIVSKCVEMYRDDMLLFVKQKLLTGKCKYKDIPANDASCRQKALDEFENSELLGDEDCFEEYMNKLLVQINTCYNKERDFLMKTLPPEVKERIVEVEVIKEVEVEKEVEQEKVPEQSHSQEVTGQSDSSCVIL